MDATRSRRRERTRVVEIAQARRFLAPTRQGQLTRTAPTASSTVLHDNENNIQARSYQKAGTLK